MNELFHSFRTAAFCWVTAGLAAVVLVVHSTIKKKKDRKQEQNYGMEGMCLGMCLGTAVGAALGNNTGIGISLGMLIGLVIGMCIHKNSKNAE